MTDNFDNEMELEEDFFEEEQEQETDGSLVSDTFYIQQGQIKLIKQFPLAFTVPDKLSPIIRDFQKINYSINNNDNHFNGNEGAADSSPFIPLL